MKAAAGDVFCVYNSGLKRYTACQVTRADQKDALLLELDWTGEEPLKPGELHDLRPLVLNFMFYDGSYDYCHVTPNVPGNYIHVGNIPPILDQDSRSYSGWGGGYAAYRQMLWEQIPLEQRQVFKEAAASRGEVTVGSVQVRRRTSRLYDTQVPFERAEELKALGCLTELNCTKWYPDLVEYLRGTPFLCYLHLENHGQRVLDLRGTAVMRLAVDLTGVEELWLPDSAGQLLLIGEGQERCVVHAKNEGAGLMVEFRRQITRYPELRRLESIHCIEVTEADLSEIAEWYPELRTLRLWGKPGVLRNFGELRRLRDLRSFSTVDLFGFGAEDIPEPEALPKLDWLWMSSLPEDAAREVRRLYKKREGIDLRVEKPRKPEWLAENLDNPFRHWDGMEGVPASAAKRAAGLYKKLRAGLRKLAEERPEDAMEQASALVRAFTKPFNRMRFVETEEREEIYGALCRVLEELPEGTLDKAALEEVFEEERDF